MIKEVQGVENTCVYFAAYSYIYGKSQRLLNLNKELNK
jgi:hypothetical protein